MQSSGRSFVLNINMIITQCCEQFLQRRLCISNKRQGIVFVRIKFSDIDIDKPHIRVLESGFAGGGEITVACANANNEDRKSTRLNSSHSQISYAVFCLKKKKKNKKYIQNTNN